MKAWINGQFVYGKNGEHPATPNSEKGVVRLRAGWNQVVIKVPQTNYGWGFYFDFLTPDGKPMLDVDYGNAAQALAPEMR
jgi:hypothetical protein